jgi:hypothetical protein
MEKCNNQACPVKDKCKRYVAKVVGKYSERTFEFETILNPDGTIRGYLCQYQKPI